MKPVFAFIGLSVICCAHAFAAENIIKDSQDMECFVYTPDVIDPAVTYQLVVGVHGAGGKGGGAAGMKNWANRGDVIVIGPSFETKGDRPYQNGDGVHAEKLIELFKILKKTYKLHDQMFLYGFSGGSQFTHRFTMLNPKVVCGVSAHSGGSWATDHYGEITTAAKKSHSLFPVERTIPQNHSLRLRLRDSSGMGVSVMKWIKRIFAISAEHGRVWVIPLQLAYGISLNNASN